jgi:cell fate (sporulation/competence/biofilm development) regulator YlbF (YheA/YmcA/DUF963 family)
METNAPHKPQKASRERVLRSQTTRLDSREGTVFITLTSDPEGQPFEVFLNLGKAGTETFAAAEALGRLSSLALRINSPLSRLEKAREMADQLKDIGGGAFANNLPSISDALARAMMAFLENDQPEAVEEIAYDKPGINQGVTFPSKQPLTIIPNPETKGKKKVQVMNDPQTVLSPELYQASLKLAEILRQAGPVTAYQNAKEQMESDPHAKSLLEKFIATQAELRVQQANQTITQEQMDHIRLLQAEVRSNPLIVRFAETQQVAIAFLPSINQQISQYIGIDFASLTSAAGC